MISGWRRLSNGKRNSFKPALAFSVSTRAPAEYLAMDREQSTAIFRILQEALTNVLRHAQATRVDVRLEEAGAALVLTIRDNGRGMTDAEQAAPHALGLLGMRERAHLIGGSVDITGMTGTGYDGDLARAILQRPEC